MVSFSNISTASFTMDDCEATNSPATVITMTNTAIVPANQSVTLIDSTLITNALNVNLVGLDDVRQSLSISNCTLTDSAETGLVSAGNNAVQQLTLTDSQFSGNQDAFTYTFGNDGNITHTVRNCSFTDNVDSAVSLLTTGKNNNITSTWTDTVVSNNNVNAGSALFVNITVPIAATFTFTRCNATYNTAYSSGGFLALNSGANTSVSINDCHFESNMAPSGGVVSLDSQGEITVNMVGVIALNNAADAGTAKGVGGFLFASVSTLNWNIENCQFSTNRATTGAVGALTNGNHFLTMDDTTCDGNTAVNGGSIMWMSYSTPQSPEVKVSDCTIQNHNDSTFYLTSDYDLSTTFTSTHQSLALLRSQFTNNTASFPGSVVYMSMSNSDGTSTQLMNQTAEFRDNVWTQNSPPIQLAFYFGTLQTLTADNNTWTENVGPIMTLSTANPSQLQLSNNVWRDNMVDEPSSRIPKGGMVTIYSYDAPKIQATASGDTVVNNTVITGGFLAVVAVQNSTTDTFEVVLDNVHMENNTAQDGGVIWVGLSNSQILNLTINAQNSYFVGNTAANNGGVVALIDESTAAPRGNATWHLDWQNCTVMNNQATNGAVLYFPSISPADNVSTLTLSDCVFQHNAASQGYTLYLNQSVNVTLTNHHVQDDHVHLYLSNANSTLHVVSLYLTAAANTPHLATLTLPATAVTLDELNVTLLHHDTTTSLFNYVEQPPSWAVVSVTHSANTTQGCFSGGQIQTNSTWSWLTLSPADCPSIDAPIAGNVTLTGITILYPNQTLNITSTSLITVQDGCFLLQGSLNLLVSPETQPDTQVVLIQGCVEGEFAAVQVDPSGNLNICAAEPQYAVTQVVLNLRGCPDSVSGPPIGAIVGGVVGGVALVALAILLAVFLYRRRQSKQNSKALQEKLARKTMNRKTLGPGAIHNLSYDAQGRSGENHLYQPTHQL